jgi:hypothetical protein
VPQFYPERERRNAAPLQKKDTPINPLPQQLHMLKSLAMKKLFPISAAVLALSLTAAAQHIAAPEVPDNLKAPAGEEVILEVHAKGFQIYSCLSGLDQNFTWTLKAPDADLFDAQGKNIGHHSAGPSWKLTDSSEVTGKVAARHDAPNASSDIPWLLLSVAKHNGDGALTRATSVQRVHTKGGQPDPSNACDESKRGTEHKVPYSADYFFYAPPK